MVSDKEIFPNLKIKKWFLWGVFSFSWTLVFTAVVFTYNNVEEQKMALAMREIQSLPQEHQGPYLLELKKMQFKVGESPLSANMRILLSHKKESNKVKKNMPQITQYVEHELNRFAENKNPAELLSNKEFQVMIKEGLNELFESKDFAKNVEFVF